MPNLLDNTIAAVSPGWGIRRARKRMQLNHLEFMAGYAAAEQNRLTKDYKDDALSADQAIVDHTPRLNSRARAAVMNNWAGASIVSAYRRHVVGTGITSRAAARHPDTGAPFDEFNRAIDRLWDRWCRDREQVDVEGRKTFLEIQTLGIGEFATVGQCFLVWSFTPRIDTVGLQLQVFETEQLDWNMFATRPTAGGNEIKGGIEVDRVGRPVAYHFHTGKHPLEGFESDSVRIPAERVRHLYRQERPRQTHGVTKLAPVLLKMHHLANYDLNQVVRARLEACIGAVIEQSGDGSGGPTGVAPPTDDTDHPTDARGNRRLRFEPGMMPVLAPGEEIKFNTPTGPGGVYQAFTEQQLVEIAAGADLDYPTMARDFRKGTFSNQRQGLIERNTATDPIQRLLIDVWCRPIREWFTTLAILENRVPAPGFLTDPALAAAYLETTHQGPAKPWIDPLKQAQAAAVALATRLTTRRDLTNELGTSETEVLRQIADEEALAAELGVSLPESSGNATPTAPPPSPDEDTDQDDKDDADEAELLARTHLPAASAARVQGNNGASINTAARRWDR